MFTKIEKSYIAKDNLDITKIVKDEDISKGILIFINEEDITNNNEILNKIKNDLKFNEYKNIGKSTSCMIYYMN